MSKRQTVDRALLTIKEDPETKQPVYGGYQEEVDKLIALKIAAEIASAKYKDQEATLKERAGELYRQAGSEEEFFKSVKLAGEQVDHVTFAFRDIFATHDFALRDQIVKALAEAGVPNPDDVVSTYFAEDRQIKLERTDDNSIELLVHMFKLLEVISMMAGKPSPTDLIKLLPIVAKLRIIMSRRGVSHRFDEFFTLKRLLKTVSGMDEQQFRADFPEALRPFLKQEAPQLRYSKDVLYEHNARQIAEEIDELISQGLTKPKG